MFIGSCKISVSIYIHTLAASSSNCVPDQITSIMDHLRQRIIIGLCVASWIISIISSTFFFMHVIDKQSYETVNLTNTMCHQSIRITKKIFLHECMKSKEKIYDLRNFYIDNNVLNADIVGFQMNKKQFGRICNFCEKI